MALPDFAPRVPRYQIEEWVNYLIAKYPATFFTGAGKRPLKKTILDDLKSEQALDDEKLEIALTFYMRDWQYQDLPPGDAQSRHPGQFQAKPGSEFLDAGLQSGDR